MTKQSTTVILILLAVVLALFFTELGSVAVYTDWQAGKDNLNDITECGNPCDAQFLVIDNADKFFKELRLKVNYAGTTVTETLTGEENINALCETMPNCDTGMSLVKKCQTISYQDKNPFGGQSCIRHVIRDIDWLTVSTNGITIFDSRTHESGSETDDFSYIANDVAYNDIVLRNQDKSVDYMKNIHLKVQSGNGYGTFTISEPSTIRFYNTLCEYSVYNNLNTAECNGNGDDIIDDVDEPISLLQQIYDAINSFIRSIFQWLS